MDRRIMIIAGLIMIAIVVALIFLTLNGSAPVPIINNAGTPVGF